MTRRPRADLRLVAPALAAWAAAALATGATDAVRAVTGALAVAVVALAVWRGARRPRPRHRDRWQGATPTLALAALLALLATVSVSVQDRVRTEGLEVALAWSGSTVVDLRTATPASAVASGLPHEGGRVRVEATLRHVTVRGVGSETRAPVVVLAPAGWADLVPGSIVRTTANLRALPRGERPVALVLAGEASLVRPAPWWERAGHTVREDLLTATAGLPEHAGLLPGIGVGEDALIPDPLAAAMRQVSLGHLLAVSGAHVAIVLTGVLVLTAGLRPGRRALVCLVVLTGLLVLVGPDPSVVRAVAMGAVVVLALVLGRRSAALPALAGAVSVLVLADPWIAREPGFALSVCATAGLVLGSGPLTQALARPGCPEPLAAALAIPLAAQLACLPVLVLLDPGIATYGVLANALVAPAVPPITVLVLLAALAGPWWPAGAHALLWVAQAGTWWIDQVARRCAELPLARLPWPAGAGGLLLLVALAGVVAVLGLTGTGRRLRARWQGRGAPLLLSFGAVLAVAGVLGVVVTPWRGTLLTVATPLVPAAFPPPDWRVLQCDVGQGSALLLSTATAGGGDAAVMVDVGPEIADTAGCLEEAGVARLDALVLTHADADHVGSLPEVRSAVTIARVLVPSTSDPRMGEVVESLLDDGVEVSGVSTGGDEGSDVTGPDGLVIGALRLTALWPTARAVEIGDDVDPNELSLTLWVEAPGLTLLVHGDLGAPAQLALTRAHPELLVAPPDVLVLAHHGSPDQDPGLLEASAGRIALISVGSDNDYGHPAPAVLEVLARSGTYVARTDLCGAIAVTVGQGGALRVSGCRAPPRERGTSRGGRG